jgi:DNA polymerase elongation subunit (family B)
MNVASQIKHRRANKRELEVTVKDDECKKQKTEPSRRSAESSRSAVTQKRKKPEETSIEHLFSLLDDATDKTKQQKTATTTIRKIPPIALEYEEEKAPSQYHYKQYKLRDKLTEPELKELAKCDRDFNFFFSGIEYECIDNRGTVMCIHGIAEVDRGPSGDTVEIPCMVRVNGFLPSFYIECLPEWQTDMQMLDSLMLKLERVLRDKYPWSREERDIINTFDRLIVSYGIEQCGEFMFYKGKQIKPYVNVSVAHPKVVPAARTLLEYPGGFTKTYDKFNNNNNGKSNEKKIPAWKHQRYGISTVGNTRSNLRLFEADVDFNLRYLVDHRYVPSTWFVAPAGKYQMVTGNNSQNIRAISKCQLEIEISHMDLRPAPPSKKVPNFIKFSFDTEFETNGKRFPQKEHDRCLQIAVTVTKQKEPGKYHQFLFCIGSVEKIDRAEAVFWFNNERDMLVGFRNFFDEMDPDVIMGYNTNGFDIPMLLGRAKVHNISGFGLWGRSKNRYVYYQTNTNKGQAKVTTFISGRINLDILRRVQDEERFGDNTLGFVSSQWLKDNEGNPMTKVEFDVSLIERFQKSRKGRTKIGIYCMEDARLPSVIEEKKKYILAYLEVSRIARIPIQTSLDRAQGARIEGRLRQECFGASEEDMKKSMGNFTKFLKMSGAKAAMRDAAKYEGAEVIKPQVGFYAYCSALQGDPKLMKAAGYNAAMLREVENDGPVLVFDAASMYPSIVEMLNLCYSTYVTNEEIERLGLKKDVDYFRLPRRIFHDDRIEEIDDLSMPAFVKPHIMRGTLPRLENELGKERGRVRGRDEGQGYIKSKFLDPLKAMYKFLTGKYEDEKEARVTVEDAKKAAAMDTLKLSEEFQAVLENEEHTAAFVTKLKKMITEAEFEFDLLDARQNAIKIWMNSIYGISGDSTSPYFMKPIATTITATGRWMLNYVKIHVESTYCRAKGYPFDARIIYGDTDSVFVHLRGFGGCVPSAFCMGTLMAKTINDLFTNLKPAKFNFEKIYLNFNLVAAKNYFGLKFMPVGDNADKVEMDTKGLRYKKRGASAWVRKTSKEAANIIATEGDIAKAIRMVQSEVERLKSGAVHLGELIEKAKLSKNLDEYGGKKVTDPETGETIEKPASLNPGVTLAKRMLAEHPEAPIRAGDFISFVIVQDVGFNKAKKISDHVEEPLKVMRENIPVDYKHYMESMRKILLKIFAGPLGYDNKPSTPPERRLEMVIDKKKKQPKYKLSTRQEREITQILFGEEKIKDVRVEKRIQNKSPMFRYLVKQQNKCLACGHIVHPYQHIDPTVPKKVMDNICESCLPCLDDIVTREKADYKRKQQDFAKCWKKCKDCLQTSDDADVEDCSNLSCARFPQREHLKKQEADARTRLSLLSIDF